MPYTKNQLEQLIKANYKAIFDIMPEAVVIFDQKGILIEANNYVLEWLGYKKADLVGKHLIDLPCVSQNSLKTIVKKFKERMQGNDIAPYEAELITKKGIKKYGIIRGMVLRNEDGVKAADLVMVTDISKEKESEMALFESEEKFQTLFDDAQDMIAVIDNQKRFSNVNKRLMEACNSSGSLIGKNIKQCHILNKDSRKNAEAIINGLLSSKYKDNFMVVEGVNAKKEKQFYEFYAIPSKKNDKTVGVIVILRNITDKILNEAKLEESEKKYRLIAENTSDFISVTELNLDPKYKYVNSAYTHFLGYEPEEMVGKKAIPFIHPEDLPALLKVAKKYIKNKAYSFVRVKNGENEFFQYRFRGKDGVWHHMESMANIADDNVIFITRDVSSRIRNENMKTEFVSLASHQLRTPLTGIHWCTKLLESQRYGKLTAEQKSLLARIIKSNDRMLALVNDLLDVAKIEQIKDEPLKKEAVSVNDIIKEITDDNTLLLENNNVSIENTIPQETNIKADKKKIKHIFNNLITNAIKYSHFGDNVTIGYETNDSEHIFNIKDKGIGIPKDQQSKIFSKLFRADNTAPLEIQGTGLGLFIAKSFVELHKGKIWYKSQENKGSTFYFSIPK